MNNFKKVMFGAGIAIALLGSMGAGVYAVSNNPGTAYVTGPARQEWRPPFDSCQAYDTLVKGSTSHFDRWSSMLPHQLSYVQVCGHQHYTNPNEIYFF